MKHFPRSLMAAAFAVTACQNTGGSGGDHKALSKKAIEIHDIIMPQISVFDKQTLLIDSLLVHLPAIKASRPDLDTTDARMELSALKTDLEAATDSMMDWMREYEPDNADTSYQKTEIQRITDVKTTFENVSETAERLLAIFQNR